MNKKVRYGILVLFMFCLLVGCGNQKDTGKVPSDVENPSNNSTDNEQANIQEKVIVDKNGIKITAKSIKYNIYNVEIEYSYDLDNDNNNDKNNGKIETTAEWVGGLTGDLKGVVVESNNNASVKGTNDVGG